MTAEEIIEGNNQEEIWIQFKHLDSNYLVSNTGRVKSVDKLVNGRNGFKLKKGKELTAGVYKGFYKRVTLSHNQIIKQYFVHQLVALCFIPNPENKPTVNHIDGNKLNNNLYNLEWATRSEQIIHAYAIGLIKPNMCWLGKKLPIETRLKMSESRKGKIPSEETKNKIKNTLSKPIINIDENKTFNSSKEAAIHYGVSKTTFCRKINLGKKILNMTFNFL